MYLLSQAGVKFLEASHWKSREADDLYENTFASTRYSICTDMPFHL